MVNQKPYSVKALFKDIADGDETAFRILFDRYKGKLYRFVLYTCKSTAVAEELVHDVFLKLWKNREMLGGVDSPDVYMFTIARNNVFDYLRQVAREARLLDELWLHIKTSQDIVQEVIESNESAHIISEAVALLSPQKKLVWKLSREEGLSHEQIAQSLNIARSTVNNHLVEAIKFVKEYLKKHNQEILFVFCVFFMDIH